MHVEPRHAATPAPLYTDNAASAGARVPAAARRSSLSWRTLRRPLFSFGLYAADLLSPLIAITVAHWLRYSAMPAAPSLRATLELQSTQFIVLAITILHVLMLRQAGIYWLHRSWLPFDTFVRVSVICGFTTLVLPLAGMGRDPIMSSRMFLIYFWLVLTTLTYSAKIGSQVLVLTMLCFDIGVKRVVVVGNSETARKLLRVFRQNPQLGYRVSGVLYRGAESGVVDDLAQVKKKLSSGTAPQMLRRLVDLNPDVVIIATSSRRNDDILNLIGECTAKKIEVRLVPEFGEAYSRGLVVDRIGLIPIIHLRTQQVPLLSAAIKRALDILLALALLPVACVFILAMMPRARRIGVSTLVQKPKVGVNGARFGVYQVNDALYPDEVRMNAHRFLLPQVFNVLRGDMSIVGPRPGDPEHVAHYSSWERRVLAVRPGILNGHLLDPAAGSAGAGDQLEWDIAYLDQRSMAFDINVIISAVLALFVVGKRKA